ncbi:MAG: PcfJ domain-containing protein [Oscillospiraceae bacterium]|nr:PcfJ domain-containing protein [Oscillospiraceae bacterium]
MLYKKELAAVPVLPCPEVKVEKKRGVYSSTREWTMTAQVVELQRSGRVLVADFYLLPDAEPYLRFASDGANFCTAEHPITTWTQRGIEGYIGYADVYEKPGTAKIVSDFFGSNLSYRTGAREIDAFCSQNMRVKRWKAADAKEALMKWHFFMYPALPENLVEYCNRHFFRKSYVFYGKLQKNGGREAHCSRCGKYFQIYREVKHNTTAPCPECGAVATWRADFHKGEIREQDDVCIAADVGGQLLLRWVNAVRTYCPPHYQEQYNFTTIAYNLYLKGGKIYFYKLRKGGWNDGTWYRGRLGEQYYHTSRIYADNLAEVFGRKYYNVDLQAGLEGDNHKLSFCDLLNNLKNEPAAEYLFKLGLPYLASTYRHRGKLPEKAGFKDYVGIGKEYLPMMKEMDITWSEIDLIKSAGCWVSEEMLERWRMLRISSWQISDARTVMQKVSFIQMLNYLEKQCRRLHVTAVSVLGWWKDYLGMSQALQVDMSSKSVRMPKDIKVAHNQVLEAFEQIRAEAEARKEIEKAKARDAAYAPAVADLYERMTIDCYSKDGFTIRLPEHVADLVREGQSLGHCVGRFNYDQKTVRGESCIIFVRQEAEPEKPFYTMEYDIKYKKIRQLYGKGNRSATPEVRKFAEGFIKRIRPRKTTREAKTA